MISCALAYLLKSDDHMHKIPILMYHSVSWEQDRRLFPYFATNTYPSIFEAHIEFLVSNGYKTIALEDLLDGKLNGARERHAIITFDDGYEDFYIHAFPILKKYRATATMFLPTRYIGNSGNTLFTRTCLDWRQVRELSDNGIRFGSHSHDHLKLTDFSAEQIEDELRTSRQIIEDKIGRPVASFSYPYAFPEERKDFIHQLRQVLVRVGFRIGVTTTIGLYARGDDLLTLKRLPINSHDDYCLFSAKIAGAYDWLNIIQNIFKRCKAIGCRKSGNASD